MFAAFIGALNLSDGNVAIGLFARRFRLVVINDGQTEEMRGALSAVARCPMLLLLSASLLAAAMTGRSACLQECRG